MRNKILQPAALVLLLMASACGPLVPLSFMKENNTRLDQVIETTDATVYLQYIKKENNFYIFDLEIINNSGETISTAPQLVSHYASSKPFTPITDSNSDVHTVSLPNSKLTMGRQYAYSPSATVKMYRKKVISAKAFSVLFAAVGVGLAIYDGGKVSKASKNEIWSRKDLTNSIGRDLLIQAAFTASEIAKASAYKTEEESHNLPYELFPECSIEPGKGVRGKIFIPKESSFRFSRIVVPVNNTDYIFDFKRQEN